MPNTPKPSESGPARKEDNRGRKAPQEQGSDYQNVHSGRKAAGHGGGSLDSDKPTDQHREPGYATSGDAQGQVPLRSREIEAEEDLESRNGPYTREGQPAGADTEGNRSSNQGGAQDDAGTDKSDDPKSRTSKPGR